LRRESQLESSPPGPPAESAEPACAWDFWGKPRT
jgi:hypothetical protein